MTSAEPPRVTLESLFKAFAEAYEPLTYRHASVLIRRRDHADYYEAVVHALWEDDLFANHGRIANWVINSVIPAAEKVNDQIVTEWGGIPLSLDWIVTPLHLNQLVSLIDFKHLTNEGARQVFAVMIGHPDKGICYDGPVAIARRLGVYDVVTVDSQMRAWCEAAMAGNPKAVTDLRAGKGGAVNGLIGPVMKASKGTAKADEIKAMLVSLLAGAETAPLSS